MDGVKKMVDKVAEKIRANLKTAENPEGILQKKEEHYMNGLGLKEFDIQEIFMQDEKYWTKSLENAKKDTGKVK